MRETTADAWVARLSTDLQTAGRLPELRLRAAAAALDRLCNSSNATAPFLNRVKREYEIQIASVASRRRQDQRVRALKRTKDSLVADVSACERRRDAVTASNRALIARQRWYMAGTRVRDTVRREAKEAAERARAPYVVTPRDVANRLVAKLGKDGAANISQVRHEFDKLAARHDKVTDAARAWGSTTMVAARREEISRVENELARTEREVDACLARLSHPPVVRDRLEGWAALLVQAEDDFAAAMRSDDVARAARIAASAPQGYLQTQDTWEMFEMRGPTALFDYVAALVDAGAAETNDTMTVKCALVAVQSGRLDVLESWVLSGGLPASLALVRALRDCCMVASAKDRFTTLASLAVAVCERLPVTASPDERTRAGEIGLELLVRRGRVRAALAFGAARHVSVPTCTAIALEVGSIPLAVALGRAAAHNTTSLDAVARLLPDGESCTVWQQWKSASATMGDVQHRDKAHEALATAFAGEVVRLSIADLSL
eukprot:m.193616 g.193616  ORF g.193616 m.193616 type:complete len:492 (+) comp18964_c0_seq1:244-1719(+)